MIQWWVPGFSFCFIYPRHELNKQETGTYQGAQIRESPKWRQSSPCPLYYPSMPFPCPLYNLCMPSLITHVLPIFYDPAIPFLRPLYALLMPPLWSLYAFSMTSVHPLYALSCHLYDLSCPLYVLYMSSLSSMTSLCPFYDLSMPFHALSMISHALSMASICPLYLLQPLYAHSMPSLRPLWPTKLGQNLLEWQVISDDGCSTPVKHHRKKLWPSSCQKKPSKEPRLSSLQSLKRYPSPSTPPSCMGVMSEKLSR